MDAAIHEPTMNEPLAPLEALSMPLGAVELPEGLQWNSQRSLAIAALKEVLASQKPHYRSGQTPARKKKVVY